MEKNIKDYLHLYLGCGVMTPDGKGKLHSVEYEAHGKPSNRVHVFFGRIVRTKHCIDGHSDKSRNYGDYAITAQRYEPIGSIGITEDGFDIPGGVKPILRHLSDMAEEEKAELLSNIGEPQMYGNGKFIISPGGYLIIQFESYSNAYGFTPNAIKYLLSKHFDLFSLIEAGLAIDKTALTDV